MNLWPLEPLHFVLLVLRNNVGFIKEGGGKGREEKEKKREGRKAEKKNR